MEWKVFYKSPCALQNSEDLLARACENSDNGLNFELCKDPSLLEKGSLYLSCDEELLFIGATGQKPMSFSWSKNLNFWSREVVSFKKNPLLRALGAKEGEWVVDATCGTGADCSFLLHAGLKVRAYERYFPTYLLLAFSYFKENISSNLEVHFGDYSTLGDQWNCPVYFDPMFDDGSKRKAKTNKEMTLFHSLLKDLPDDSSMVAKRLLEKTNRLVVKRPPKGDLLLDKPNAQWVSKAVRFDLYI